jgi:formate dehydrogenase maturation protein FdhE
MSDETKQPNASDILRCLHESVQLPEQDVSAMPLKDIQAELARRGLDTAPLLSQIKQRLAKARAELEISAARTQREQTLQKMRTLQAKLGEFSVQVRERAMAVLNQLSASNPTAAAAYFSKFENASEADLQSLLDDLSLLDESHDDDDASGNA